jgi:hypothetical protein
VSISFTYHAQLTLELTDRPAMILNFIAGDNVDERHDEGGSVE